MTAPVGPNVTSLAATLLEEIASVETVFVLVIGPTVDGSRKYDAGLVRREGWTPEGYRRLAEILHAVATRYERGAALQ